MAKKILVIDDSSAIRQIVSLTLSTSGYETIEAADGLDALSKLEGTEIDLFVCDVNMPNMNGIEFLHAIKSEAKYEAYRFTPIIMLTTESGEDMKLKGKEAGAKTWLIKPFQPATLIEAVKKFIT
jgi:two-component system chemotaxis response regulator CheY